MKPADFVDALSAIHLDAVFNPYSDCCHLYDLEDAPRRRRANLHTFIDAASRTQIDSMWVARDLGYRGGRRTGLPLTDEVHLPAFRKAYGGLSISRATVGPPLAERTAAIIWQVLTRIESPVFLWNIFPLHPFDPDDPLSNRCHTRKERQACESLFFALLEMLNPKRIVAIGKDAERALTEFDLPCQVVRHPSYGGQTTFINTMAEIYQLKFEIKNCPTGLTH